VYDRNAMRAILISFHSQTVHPVTKVFLDDNILSNEKIGGKNLCVLDSGHKNHAHIEIRPKTLSLF
jgi:hypothetical protein